ncbi:MAG: hypothetical protein M3O84_07000 [Actinomycetota bacterium]|nr:hypothetical protein [Actinomycetota bacterium]
MAGAGMLQRVRECFLTDTVQRRLLLWIEPVHRAGFDLDVDARALGDLRRVVAECLRKAALGEHRRSQIGHHPPQHVDLLLEPLPDLTDELRRHLCVPSLEPEERALQLVVETREVLDRPVVQLRSQAPPLVLGTPGRAVEQLAAFRVAQRDLRASGVHLAEEPTHPREDEQEDECGPGRDLRCQNRYPGSPPDDVRGQRGETERGQETHPSARQALAALRALGYLAHRWMERRRSQQDVAEEPPRRDRRSRLVRPVRHDYGVPDVSDEQRDDRKDQETERGGASPRREEESREHADHGDVPDRIRDRDDRLERVKELLFVRVHDEDPDDHGSGGRHDSRVQPSLTRGAPSTPAKQQPESQEDARIARQVRASANEGDGSSTWRTY